ncbi:MAG: hypothetical protein FJX42_03095, partial [Alphaproteobacteria bacterium]|nr:hypothetical protein [Alphaproteobacteria bacterium]
MKTTLPRGRMSGLALVASAILMWGAPAASAADAPGAQSAAAAQGIVNAVGYLPLPDRPVLMVRPLDNSDDNMKIKTEIENTLRARGYGVAASSPLVLSFDTRNEVGAWSETDRRTILELKAEGGREGGEYAHAKVNIFDSAAGGL